MDTVKYIELTQSEMKRLMVIDDVSREWHDSLRMANIYPPTPGVYRTEWGNPHTAVARAGRNNGQLANKVAKNRARNKAARKARRK